jgi:predicted TIM-barrel fold metal-dependent hydrolase
MTPARFEMSPATDAFVAALRRSGVELPLQLHDEEVGSVVDAAGREVFVVDHNGEMPDERAGAIAAWLICAANTCGGYLAVMPARHSPTAAGGEDA